MGEFVARNTWGWIKKNNKRKSCCILLVIYVVVTTMKLITCQNLMVACGKWTLSPPLMLLKRWSTFHTLQWHKLFYKLCSDLDQCRFYLQLAESQMARQLHVTGFLRKRMLHCVVSHHCVAFSNGSRLYVCSTCTTAGPINLLAQTASCDCIYPHYHSPPPPMALQPMSAMASSFLKRFLKHTRWFKYDRDCLCVNKPVTVPVIFEPPCTWRRTTVGRTPLDEWSARCRDLYLTTHNTYNRQTSMPPAGF